MLLRALARLSAPIKLVNLPGVCSFFLIYPMTSLSLSGASSSTAKNDKHLPPPFQLATPPFPLPTPHLKENTIYLQALAQTTSLRMPDYYFFFFKGKPKAKPRTKTQPRKVSTHIQCAPSPEKNMHTEALGHALRGKPPPPRPHRICACTDLCFCHRISFSPCLCL